MRYMYCTSLKGAARKADFYFPFFWIYSSNSNKKPPNRNKSVNTSYVLNIARPLLEWQNVKLLLSYFMHQSRTYSCIFQFVIKNVEKNSEIIIRRCECFRIML